MTIPLISDEFTSKTGTLRNFDNIIGIKAPNLASLATPFAAPTNGLPIALLNRHIDIRGFVDDNTARGATQADLGAYHQGEIAYRQRLSVDTPPDAGYYTITFTDADDVDHSIIALLTDDEVDLKAKLAQIVGTTNITVEDSGGTFPFTITFPTSLAYISLLDVESSLTVGGNPVTVSVSNDTADSLYLQTANIEDPTKTQGQMATLTTVRTENWSIDSPGYTMEDLEVGPINTYNNWNGLRLTFDGATIGTTYLTSRLTDRPINLYVLEDDVADIEISMAVPGITGLPINLATSTVQFTSEALGRFGFGQDSIEVPFEGNVIETGGFAEFLADLSEFDNANINWHQITGVRFKLSELSTPVGQFIVLGIRAFSKVDVWQPLSLDTNTITERLATPVPRNGDTGAPASYTLLPPILRANLNVPSGAEDPRPSDVSLAVRFYTGGLVSGTNKLQLYFRENEFSSSHTEMQVAEIEFSASTLKISRYMIKREFSGGNYTDTLIGSLSQRVQDTNTPPLEDERPAPGSLAPLKANTTYMFQAEVINKGFRVGIFELDSNGVIDFPHYETNFEYQSEWVRRAGRVGFGAVLGADDISLEYFRNSSTAYSILRTAVFRTRTPVDGAQLFVSSSGPKQLFSEFLPIQSGDQVFEDVAKNPNSQGKTWQAIGNGMQLYGGVKTNPIYFEDFDNTWIEFDIWLPADMVRTEGKTPRMYFIDPADNANPLGGSVIGPLDISAVSNGFTHNKINLNLYKFRPIGTYEVIFMMETPTATPWWVSNMQVNRRTVSWEFRARAAGEWIPFNNMINDDKFALNLGRDMRGREVQLQARALTQDAWIAEYDLRPHHAELGLVKNII